MPTAVLTFGVPIAMAQNTVYALPANRCIFFTDATSPTIQESTDVAFTANAVVTLANGQAEVGGGFIRSTAGAITGIVKKL